MKEETDKTLTKLEAIKAMAEGKKVTHEYFTNGEWMTIDLGKIVFEDGVRCSIQEFYADRQGDSWGNGYRIVEPKAAAGEDKTPAPDLLKGTTPGKPISAKPQLYAFYFAGLKEIARGYGYNLVIDGSMARDCDLIAFPWAAELRDEFEMIQAFDRYLTCASSTEKEHYLFGDIHGRHKYVINLDRGGYLRNGSGDIVDPIQYKQDPYYYIDISVIASAPATAAELQEAKERGDKHFKAWEVSRDRCNELQSQFDKAQSKAVNLGKELSEARKRIEELTGLLKEYMKEGHRDPWYRRVEKAIQTEKP